mgnify:CR=1 FL=1|tara:strand:- start:4532 stop:4735 length:204 start_codon:yes stop_codon:yes gene_type:complete
MSEKQRLVNKLMAALQELDVGFSTVSARINPLTTINRALSKAGASRINSIDEVSELRRALSSAERLL